MALLTAAFVACLVCAHLHRGGWDALALELCLFREGDSWLLGYLMFALLTAIGGMLVWRLAHDPEEAANYDICSSVFLLLLIIAATDARNPFHVVASLVVIGGLYVYYASMLNEWDHPWRRAHVMMPVALLMIPPMGSFGSWQKGMILYLVALINVHYRALSPQTQTALRRKPRRKRLREPRPAESSVFVPATGERRRRSLTAYPRCGAKSSSHG